MEFALGLVAVIFTVCIAAGISQRINISTPLLLVCIGFIASYLLPLVFHEFKPELDPQLVLVVILPPLLYAAALQTSVIDIRANRRAIGFLSVGYVIFTTLGVGLVAYWVFPGIPPAAAIALGAVVAPPDAVAATTIARRVGMPRRIVSLLESESLANDATALVALRAAIASLAGAYATWELGRDFLLAAGLGIGIGLVVGVILVKVRYRMHNVILNTSISLIAPFLAFLPAEMLQEFLEIPASGVLAVVVCGLMTGTASPSMPGGASRLSERSNWKTVQFLLENTVFLLIGLQGKSIIESIQADSLGWAEIWWGCLIILLTVLILRPLWIFPAVYLPYLFPSVRRREPQVNWAEPAVVSWAGMRGVVTLAAALSLPADISHRPAIILAALVVVAGTLLIQGLTLPVLVRWLPLEKPNRREDLLAEAAVIQRATTAGVERLEKITATEDPPEVINMLKRRTEERSLAAWERLGGGTTETQTPSQRYALMRLQMLDAERQEVLSLRSGGPNGEHYPHEVLSEVLNQLDVEESMLEAASDDPELEVPDGQAVREGGCEHLRSAANPPVPEEPYCAECRAEGAEPVHLRMCLECGKVACCDSTPGMHATKHFQETQHPVMRSVEPGENWRWCYVDELLG